MLYRVGLPDASIDAEKAGKPAVTPPPEGARATVLVVDDDAMIRDAIRDSLDEAGIVPAMAGDGGEALALLRGGLRPSVILLDLMMPRVDGWDFREAQRADPTLKDIPVVVLTAAGFSPASIRLQFGEDVMFLPKPFGPDALLDVIAGFHSDRALAATG